MQGTLFNFCSYKSIRIHDTSFVFVWTKCSWTTVLRNLANSTPPGIYRSQFSCYIQVDNMLMSVFTSVFTCNKSMHALSVDISRTVSQLGPRTVNYSAWKVKKQRQKQHIKPKQHITPEMNRNKITHNKKNQQYTKQI